ncbi:MAG: hypothetical protein QOC68_1913 [Solirubrobacteraceae bacterium]|nr:hypothetical protein [Solirubrobacteraceae bacterium]
MVGSAIWDVERIRRVAAEWDAALRALLPAYARLVAEAEDRGSVLRPSAAEHEIVAAETRLGGELPPSYRSFLAVSDGADAGVLGADRIERFYGEDRNALCRVEDLRPLSEHVDWLVPGWLDAFADHAHDQKPPSADETAQVFDFEPGLRALALTEPQQHGTLALVPFPDEWQVWDFGHSEVTTYVSFGEYLLHQARDARTRVAERESRVRMAVADGSSLAETKALAEHGDRRAVDAACRALSSEGPIDDRFVVLLIQLGDPKAIPTLRDACARATDDQTRLMLQWALISCGDTDELNRVVASGAQPDAGWAADLLERRQQIPRW